MEAGRERPTACLLVAGSEAVPDPAGAAEECTKAATVAAVGRCTGGAEEETTAAVVGVAGREGRRRVQAQAGGGQRGRGQCGL